MGSVYRETGFVCILYRYISSFRDSLYIGNPNLHGYKGICWSQVFFYQRHGVHARHGIQLAVCKMLRACLAARLCSMPASIVLCSSQKTWQLQESTRCVSRRLNGSGATELRPTTAASLSLQRDVIRGMPTSGGYQVLRLLVSDQPNELYLYQGVGL